MSEQVLESYAAERAARLAANRTFEFEGISFTYKAAIPVAVLDAFLARDGSIEEIVAICDATARACLENPEAWDQVRADDHQPLVLDFAGVLWLADQIVTRSTGIPTDAPSASSAGQETGATAAISTDASSSAAETPDV